MPRLSRLTGAATAVLALGLVAATPAPPAPGSERLVTDSRVLTHFDLAAGRTPENIALAPDGSADLTFAYARQVAHVTPEGLTRIRATLPAVARPATPLVHRAVVTGIARAHDGTLYVNYATGTRRTGIWRLSPDGGAPEKIAALPADGLPNGLALDEHQGVLYAADSVRGTVWRVPQAGGTATKWASGPALAPLPAPPAHGFGANGIKVRRDAVWVSNSDRGTLLRIPVGPDGTAGPVETRADALTGIDDFAFPGHGRSVLAALNSGNQVVLIHPDGAVHPVLTAEDGLSNPTSVAVRGRTVYVPSAAFTTRRDPNLLLARLRHLIGRG
ncbi:SMP-30/gluconolactonase/LRE family protein [Streptomyces cinerochromogenes]|uniref:SMP-30/gluconolactonase/LRE family protein n=1 Tax=Streptomyces cinerochromogenes TaxID=66422 RepID=UPI0033B2F0D8